MKNAFLKYFKIAIEHPEIVGTYKYTQSEYKRWLAQEKELKRVTEDESEKMTMVEYMQMVYGDMDN